MAVQNPFEAQPPAPPPAPSPAPQGGIVASAMPATQTYKPATRTVDSKGTVSGQVDSILANDGPLMQRARTLALEQMNGRGLINSSMAVGAAQAAMVDKALPMAQQDANTYDSADRDNQGYINRASEFNAGNAFQGAQQDKQLSQQESQFSRGQSQQESQFSRSNTQQQGQFEAQQAQQAQQFQSNQDAAFRQQAIQNEAALKQLGVQMDLQNKQVPANFAANVSTTTMERVNSIMGDPNLDAAAKKNAVDNVVNFANSTLAWAEKFYSAPMPSMFLPGQQPAPTAAPAAAPAPAPAPAAPAPAPQAPLYAAPLPTYGGGWSAINEGGA